jgi:tripartite-type tricarboxylate transporter receptor subunit TctC
MNRRDFARAAALAPLAAAMAPHALAQGTWPDRPIKWILSQPAGSGPDILARYVSEQLARTWKQPVVIENRPGGQNVIGAQAAARSAPDGYTMVVSASSLHGITPFLYSKLTYDPNKDLVPVIVLAGFSNVLVVHPTVKANTVSELTALAKAQPGKLSCASSGSGSTIHMSCEMYKHMLGLQIEHVPYKGSGPAMIDLVGGQVNLMFDNIPSAISHIRAGKLRALATTGAKRATVLPDVPTMVEAGVAGYESTAWFGLAMPAGTPPEIIARVNAEGQKTTRAPEFMKRMADLGYEIIGGTSEQMAAMIRDEMRRWGPIVKASGAKVD